VGKKSVIWLITLAVVMGYFLLQWSGSNWSKWFGENGFLGIGVAKQAPEMKVVFCDVGQGDATYIRAPEGQDILIDGGPDDSVLTCLGKSMPFFDHEIDLVMFSHPEADHISGLIEVLRRYKVDKVIWSGLEKNTPEYFALKEEMRKTNSVKMVELPGCKYVGEVGGFGDVREFGDGKCAIEIGDQKKVKISFYYPFELPAEIPNDVNNWSMVEKVSFGKEDVLFTGDIMQGGTERMLETLAERSGLSRPDFDQAALDRTPVSLADLDVEVLKVPHHGSKNGLTPELLAVASPEYAVIPVGLNNSYGHPHQSILDLLLGARVKIYRTDLDGDVTMTTDGKDLQFSIAGGKRGK